MNMIWKNLLVVTAVIALAGCSGPAGKRDYFRDRSGDYTRAETLKPIKVPEDLAAKPLGNVLAIPAISATDAPEKAAQVPRPKQRLSRGINGETYSIEQNGKSSWLLAAKKPGELWPRIEAFAEESGLPVASAMANKRLLTTGWVNLGKDSEYGLVLRSLGKLVGIKDLDPMEDRFRIEVVPGAIAGSAEIHIQHQGRPLSGKGRGEPSRWNNLEDRSFRMVKALAGELLVFLARIDEEGSVSYLSQKKDISADAELTQDGNGNPILAIRGLSYAQGWSAVGEALTRARIAVSDRNRSAGLYYLSAAAGVSTPEKKSGWFSRLMGSKKKAVAQESGLHLRVSWFPDMIQVSVEKDASTSADKKESQKLLKRVRESLQ